MTYKYSICHPDQKDIEYRNTPISKDEVLQIAKDYPWLEKLKAVDNLKPEEFHYNPSLDFICIENNRSFCLTANFDEDKNLEFSLWYNRPKKVRAFFGLFGEKEKMVVEDIRFFGLDKSLEHLEHFVNGEYAVVEKLFEK